MKDKCCCCEQRERFRREDAESHRSSFCMVLLFFVLLMIPIWGWAIIIALWLMNSYPRTAITIILIASVSLISVMSYKISAYNDEAEYWNKRRERLEAAWPLEQNTVRR